jgi:hypothetical protein
VRIVSPTPLMRDAAAVVASIKDDVVVIGAVAVAVAVSQGAREGLPAVATRDLDLVRIGPTLDVDLALEPPSASRVVRALTDAGLEPSEHPGERGFTWIKGDLKVQLMTPPGPPRMGGGQRLPVQPALSLVREHRVLVAFEDSADTARFWTASAAALVALKRAAFGRTTHDGTHVERDYHDAFQLLSAAGTEIIAELRQTEDAGLRMQVRAAAEDLARGGVETQAAARERERLGLAESQRSAEADVLRAARGFLRQVG